VSEERPIERRGFFRAVLGRSLRTAAETMRAVGEGVHDARRELARRYREADEGPGEHWARPPGAVPEDMFRQRCTRCGDCVPACPALAIREGPDGYPRIEPNVQACAVCEDPLPCIESCETGALLPWPRASIRLGLARLDPPSCLVVQGRECRSCEVHCPFPGEAIRLTDQGPKFVEASCTGCGLCAVVCPTRAITVGRR